MDLKILLDTPPWEWPEGIGRTFKRLLRDPSSNRSERLIAAKLGGDLCVMDDDMAETLLRVLKNAKEPEELRAKAAISLGPSLEMAYMELDEETEGFEDAESVPISEDMFRRVQQSLREVYLDTGTPRLVRRRVLEAAVRCPEPWHEDAVREAYASGDRDWVLTAVFAMQYISGFEAETLEALQSGDPEIHREAVAAAGEKELDAAWGHISALASDPGTEKDLRIAAIGALGGIRPVEAQGILLELADSDDEDIAEAADEALTMIGPDDSLDEVDEDDEDEELID
jgi:hypothetical protein